jgi:hypothetical protein
METAHTFDAIMTRAEEQVVGIREDDFGVKIVDEIARRKAFDGTLGADGHEYRRFDSAVSGVKEASARAGLGAGGLDFKTETGLRRIHDCMVARDAGPSSREAIALHLRAAREAI